MRTITKHLGVEYDHAKYNTAAKRKDLPEKVREAIEGKQINKIQDNEL